MTDQELPPEDMVEYHENNLVIFLIEFGLGIALIALFFPGTFQTVVAEFTRLEAGTLTTLVQSNPLLTSHVLLFIFLLIYIHETIHVWVYSRNGYRPTVGFRIRRVKGINLIPNPYVGVFDERIPRNQNLKVLLAPLFWINVVALVFLLPVFPAVVQLHAVVAIIVNSAESCADIYNAVRAVRKPSDTEYLNVETSDGIKTYHTAVS